jgi:hypothetical protein
MRSIGAMGYASMKEVRMSWEAHVRDYYAKNNILSTECLMCGGTLLINLQYGVCVMVKKLRRGCMLCGCDSKGKVWRSQTRKYDQVKKQYR